MQFTADNIDINDSLLDGNDTFHVTQVPGWQKGPDKTKHLASLRPTDRTTLVIPEALCRNCRQLISWKTKVSQYLQNLLNKISILFSYFFWRQAYFPKPVLPNPKETGWAQAEDLLVSAFMTLNSNPKASLAWFQVGAPLAAQLFSVNAESHISCVLGTVVALRSTLTAASNVVLFLQRLKDFMD